MPTMEVDLSALRDNFKTLQRLSDPTTCSAVVKANAYGVGSIPVVEALCKEGCSFFWVAYAEEGMALRAVFPDVDIAVLQGFSDDTISQFLSYKLIPVLSTSKQLTLYSQYANQLLNPIVQIDTGLNRLGLSSTFWAELSAIPVRYVMSHLACADSQSHFMNEKQLENLRSFQQLYPEFKLSLSASDGIFLGNQFHFDLVRAGAALYGINTTPYRENIMKPVISVKAPILQVSTVPEGSYVGYGATYRTVHSKKIATVSLGYHDGVCRALSNRGRLWYEHYEAPMIGRVSMDMVTCDISSIPEGLLKEGDDLYLVNSFYTVDDVARDSGTIGYELLTGFGDRIKRRYLN